MAHPQGGHYPHKFRKTVKKVKPEDGHHFRRAADCRPEGRPAVQVVRGHRVPGHGLHAAHPRLHEGHGTAVATPLEQERTDCGRVDGQGEAILVLAFLSQDRVHGLGKRRHTGAAVAVEGGDIEWVNDIRERRGKLGDYEQYFNTLFEHFVGGSKAGITLKQLLWREESVLETLTELLDESPTPVPFTPDP